MCLASLVIVCQPDQLHILTNSVQEKSLELCECRDHVLRYEEEKSKAEKLLQLSQAELESIKAKAEADIQSTVEIGTLRAELSSLRLDFQSKEDMIKKLTAKLKTKIKEVNDFSVLVEKMKQDIASLTEKNDQYNLAVDLNGKLTKELRDELHEKYFEIDQLKGEKLDLELKSKQLSELLINHEDKLTSFGSEKSKLRDEFCKLEQEHDVLRQRCFSAETQFNSLQVDYNQKVNRLHDIQGELDKQCQARQLMEVELQRLTVECDRLAKEVQHLQESELKLIESNVLNRKYAEEIEQLKQHVSKERFDSQAKEDQANEKIKKLKGLLNKVNTLSQEKDSKIAQMETLYKRPRRFAVLSRVAISGLKYEFGETTYKSDENVWNYILVDTPPNADAADSCATKTRWVDSQQLEEWLAQGSSLIGKIPETLDSMLRSSFEIQLKTLSESKNVLQRDYDDISQQFQTYKIRAQTALKRVNNEDRERQKQKELEFQELERLKDIIDDYVNREHDYNSSVCNLQQQLSENMDLIESLKSTINEKNLELRHIDEKVQNQSLLISSLTRDINDLREHNLNLEEDLKKKEMLYEQNVGSFRQSYPSEVSTEIPPRIQFNSAMQIESVPQTTSSPVIFPEKSVLVSEITEEELMMDITIHTPEKGRSPSGSENFEKPAKSGAYPDSVAPLSKILSGSNLALIGDPSEYLSKTSKGQPAKLMIFQQADHLLKESLQVLREENSNLLAELLELRNDFGLREEQVWKMR